MKIKTIVSEYRNDFRALMECEHCGAEWLNKYGYHDNNYHVNVIPHMFCNSCGKNRSGESRPAQEGEAAQLVVHSA